MPPVLRTRTKGPAIGRNTEVEAVALVSRSRREPLLSIHRHRLVREDLEDCYSQATLELLARAQRRGGFASRAHIANALEQRFLARVNDRHRALNGRSPIEAALARAVPLTAGDTPAASPVDARVDVQRTILARHELRRIAELSHELSADQRLVLAHRLSDGSDHIEFCRAHGWTVEKYHKVAQRARARLRKLLDDELNATPAGPAPSSAPAVEKKSKRLSSLAPPVGRESRDTPMTTPRPHRRVPWDADGRLTRRSNGASHPHVVGRERDISPSSLPAARVTGHDHGRQAR